MVWDAFDDSAEDAQRMADSLRRKLAAAAENIIEDSAQRAKDNAAIYEIYGTLSGFNNHAISQAVEKNVSLDEARAILLARAHKEFEKRSAPPETKELETSQTAPVAKVVGIAPLPATFRSGFFLNTEENSFILSPIDEPSVEMFVAVPSDIEEKFDVHHIVFPVQKNDAGVFVADETRNVTSTRVYTQITPALAGAALATFANGDGSGYTRPLERLKEKDRNLTSLLKSQYFQFGEGCTLVDVVVMKSIERLIDHPHLAEAKDALIHAEKLGRIRTKEIVSQPPTQSPHQFKRMNFVAEKPVLAVAAPAPQLPDLFNVEVFDPAGPRNYKRIINPAAYYAEMAVYDLKKALNKAGFIILSGPTDLTVTKTSTEKKTWLQGDLEIMDRAGRIKTFTLSFRYTNGRIEKTNNGKVYHPAKQAISIQGTVEGSGNTIHMIRDEQIAAPYRWREGRIPQSYKDELIATSDVMAKAIADMFSMDEVTVHDLAHDLADAENADQIRKDLFWVRAESEMPNADGENGLINAFRDRTGLRITKVTFSDDMDAYRLAALQALRAENNMPNNKLLIDAVKTIHNKTRGDDEIFVKNYDHFYKNLAPKPSL
ncbi:MAG: hypothetical protein DI551_03395 [Micavibrio aeruginosavorus]|uniref:Uncharacterized protein n=1 Tax=Micavibrio aeruginosavorus TaxID=349221 RepID=A0A2W5Q7P6_9BACT|nr:MAG: hypothetical protein DI551_03395 [Micavibrio aeruginosavorus]